MNRVEKNINSKTLRLKVFGSTGRLDSYVASQCTGLSRSLVAKLIEQGRVLLNGKTVKPGSRPKEGDVIEVALPPPPISPLIPQNLPLDIVYEDNDVLVVNKPPGMVVYPAAGHPDSTLLNAVIHHCPDLAFTESSLRPGVVHRLDKDTSGLMVLAKSKSARENLVGQFKARTVTKEYLVLVKGRLSPREGIIEAPLGRHPSQRQRIAVVKSGREAHTRYRVKQYLGDFTLVEAAIETGRTHQIRVHMAAIGFPVVGDSVYGVRSPNLDRQFLHAFRLGFRLPSSGEYREFTVGLPDDLERALKAMSGDVYRRN
ncbi:MAG: RluA family pseudouridine synthase [Chloroflexota bacterium]